MNDTERETLVKFAKARLAEAAKAWVQYQWLNGLLEIEDRKTRTGAEHPNYGDLLITLAGDMMSIIPLSMRDADRGIAHWPDAHLILEYVRRLLGSELRDRGVEPEIVRIQTGGSGETVLRFKQRSRSILTT